MFMDKNVSMRSVLQCSWMRTSPWGACISVHGYKRLTEKRVAVFTDKNVSLRRNVVFVDKNVSMRSVLQC